MTSSSIEVYHEATEPHSKFTISFSEEVLVLQYDKCFKLTKRK